MNTRFEYLYRDACNYKSYNDVVVSGVLNKTDIQPYLKDKTFFIPSEIGLPDLQEMEFSPDDHIWHEIESISPTNDAPTITFSAREIIEGFRKASQNGWNEYVVFSRKGLI